MARSLRKQQLPSGTNGSSMPQHAAACRSMPQRQILGAVGGGFEACRSMPQHAAASQNFHMADFFFHNMSNL